MACNGRSFDGEEKGKGYGDFSKRKGQKVQFFLEVDWSAQDALFLRPAAAANFAPKLLQSHGWIEGTLQEAFAPDLVDPEKPNTWALVQPSRDLLFESRSHGGQAAVASKPLRVLRVREPNGSSAPILSLILVRWGAAYSPWMDDDEPNDGDWGVYGSPPSDEYMAAMVKLGVLKHPQLKDSCNVEILNVFVKRSKEIVEFGENARRFASVLKGRHRSCFWMLWPAEWEDTGDPDFACYIERQSLFRGMRACEAAGLRTGFPHPADQFELITSKSWMASLSLTSGMRLPAAVLVNKGSVVLNANKAAADALEGLATIRHLNPFPVGPDETPAPAEINKDGVQKGVVKLGWSWENRFVLTFNGAKQLESRLKEIMNQPGCTVSSCVVQEWVDFDFEMRLYFLPPRQWTLPLTLKPTRIECNCWGERKKKETLGHPPASFSKLSEAMILERWSQDTVAWSAAKEQATQTAQLLLAWLRTANAQPFPMIRLDFMVKRIGQGKARVIFGEYCEMGACCLGWKEGPPTIWQAAIDALLA